ncbi:MAG: ROK family protein [Marivibrio sp.]|uniref:ROK family protein n=1 Tax=Marivibrio sp. TaxID=2039719 RepID=UPI0032EDE900
MAEFTKKFLPEGGLNAAGWTVGVDLGGTKIEAALAAPDGALVARPRAPTPRGDYAGTIEAIAALVATVTACAPADVGPIPVGVGMPGALSRRTGLVKNANSTWLIGKPLDHDLARRLGRPVRVANDADCFALSEAIDGAAAGADVVFGVILGTGVGGGVVVGGRPLASPNGIAGEWGHNPLPWADPARDPAHACYCGKRGCIETYLSGPGFAAHAGIGADAAEIAAAARAGDSEAAAALDLYCDRLARGLAGAINILDPDVIVLGGGLSHLSELYERVPTYWKKYVFSDHVETRLTPPLHGDSGGVRGAAWLWRDADPAAILAWSPPHDDAPP